MSQNSLSYSDHEKRAVASTGEKIDNTGILRTLKRLWRYLEDSRARIICAILLTFLSNTLALFGPMLSGRAIDAIQPGPGAVLFSKVFFYSSLMIVFYTISAGMNYFLMIQMVAVSQNTVSRVRKEIFEKLMSLPVSFFDRNKTGDIISHISYDVDTLNTSLSSDLLQICTSTVTVLGSLLMMLSISPALGLVFIVTIPMAARFLKHRAVSIHEFFHRRSEKLGAINGFIEEIVSGEKTIKAYHQEETMLARFDERNEEAVQAYYKADYESAVLGPFVNFINNISLSLISVFGAFLYLFGYLSLGNLSSFVLYSRKFSGPINEASNIISEIQSAFAAISRIFTLIDETPEPPDSLGAISLGAVKGGVEFAHVYFGYDADAPVLRDVNLSIPPGSLTAIVGRTGAGKTTIINLLMRFYDAESGRIALDGHEIGNIKRTSLRHSYAMVLQDSWFFRGTIFDNIAYGKEGVTREEVVEAAQAAQAHRFIEALPLGYDTLLTDGGVNISQGQKQLLTIARAMLLDVQILILDEATSNVDTRTEIEVQKAMRILMKGKTCFVIAHRLSTIRNADMTLVMQDGNVAEQGSHDELIQKDGIYAALYRAQFGDPVGKTSF
jgi:ATP-binding cassette subfamily B protein